MTNEVFLAFLLGMMLGGLLLWALQFRRIRRLRINNDQWLRLAQKVLEDSNFSPLEYNPYQKNLQYFRNAELMLRDLRRHDERVRAVLNTMTEGLALLENSGRVALCNPAFTGMFRVESGSRLSSRSFEKASVQDYISAMKAAQDTGKVTTAELHLGTTPPRDILLTFRPYSDETIVDGCILTAIDITSRKRAEVLRTEFVANVSHELRTPLAAILGYLETMVELAQEEEPAATPFKRFIGIIHQHAQRLNALIEDLLILSRIESRQGQLRPQLLQVSSSVNQAITTLSTAADRKEIALINALPPLLPDVKADPSALERILINLVDNAIKYSDDHSEVQITARVQSGEVIVVVSDQGMGIPAEDQKRIFERFYRVDRARSRAAGGTGLGLSIVKHLVQTMGGEIWVDSVVGKGSTFSFSLPVASGKDDLQPASTREGLGVGR
jgi:two-component system, OmpR family, phosphate regulon sensor histidine kinase PhoR